MIKNALDISGVITQIVNNWNDIKIISSNASKTFQTNIDNIYKSLQASSKDDLDPIVYLFNQGKAQQEQEILFKEIQRTESQLISKYNLIKGQLRDRNILSTLVSRSNSNTQTQEEKALFGDNPEIAAENLDREVDLIKLAEIVKKHDLFLIADEVYREFIYDGEEHFSVMNVAGLEEHAIMIDSVSKRYSMCGARIGCIVSKNKEVMNTAMKFAQARLSPPTYAQIASEAALDTPQSYFDAVITEYNERRDVLIAALQNIEGVTVATPKGAFYCIAKLPVDNADTFAQWLLESYDYKGETVMVAPAAGFYSTPNVGLDEVRIAYVLKKEDLIQAVTILKEALAVYNK